VGFPALTPSCDDPRRMEEGYWGTWTINEVQLQGYTGLRLTWGELTFCPSRRNDSS
jgi:hypothetical protein